MRLVFFNQMAGTLFRELCENVAQKKEGNVVLYTGHPQTIEYGKKYENANFKIFRTVTYNKNNYTTRLVSWVVFCLQCSTKILRLRQSDLIVASTNPPLLPFVTWVFTRITRNKYFVIVYDIYPDVLEQKGLLARSGMIFKTLQFLNNVALANSAAIVTLNSGMQRKLATNLKRAQKTIHILEPWVDLKKIAPLRKRDNQLAKKLGLEKKFVVLYAGNMGFSHDIESILGAAGQLKSVKGIKFLFVGDGYKSNLVNEYLAQFPNENVKLLPPQSDFVFPSVLNLADISIASVDVGFEDLMIPSKVFSYMASGSAVIGIVKSPSVLAELIKLNKCGSHVSPQSVDMLAHEILRLFQNRTKLKTMKINARCYAEQQCGLEDGITTFIKILDANNISWRDN